MKIYLLQDEYDDNLPPSFHTNKKEAHADWEQKAEDGLVYTFETHDLFDFLEKQDKTIRELQWLLGKLIRWYSSPDRHFPVPPSPPLRVDEKKLLLEFLMQEKVDDFVENEGEY